MGSGAVPRDEQHCQREGTRPPRIYLRSLALASCLVTASALSAGSSDPPSLSLADMAGEPQEIASYVGKVVILNFWATWCVPCKQEMPMLDNLQARYEDQGVVIIGASADDSSTRDRIRPFLESHGISFPIWTGATARDMDRFGLGTALPATAIIDQDGQVAFRLLGPLHRRQLRQRLDYLLSGSQGRVPERLASTLADSPGAHGSDSHDHGEDESHAHGGVGMEGASLVPS